ncbi:MAG: signal peptidase I [Spirochaetaceae bacterium]|nr:MAG: signal peptidase I [Spirochaetaceae bacterium]
MFRSRAARRYSLYHDRSRRRRPLRLIRFLVLLFLGYQLLTLLLVSSLRIDSSSMAPSLAVSDRVLASPVGYGVQLPLLPWATPALREPQRSDIVVLASPYHSQPATLLRLVDPLVRFLTVNRVSAAAFGAPAWDNPFVVMRVVGLPGDTVEISNWVARVIPAGSSQSAGEHSLAHSRYSLELGDASAGDGQLLFRDSAPLTLGPDEYFVLGDNRAAAVDSRHFGPVSRADLRQRVFLRYWPLQRFGVPAN